MSSRLKNPLTRLNVRQQMVLLFLILVSPVFLLNWYANTKAEQILKEHVTNAYEELNKQNHVLINRDIDTINRIMSTIIQNPITQKMIINKDELQFDRVRKYAAMTTLLGNNSVGVFGGEAVYYFLFVYDPNGNYGFAPSTPNIDRQTSSSSVFFYSDLTKTPWMEKALKEKGKGVLAYIDNFGPKGDQKTLAYLRVVNNISKGNSVVGILVATKMDKKIEESLSTVSLPEGGEIYLTDWSNRILASSTSQTGDLLNLPESVGQTAAREETSNTITDEFIYVVHSKLSLQQKLIYRIPVKSLLQQQSALKKVIQMISIVYSLFAIIVMMYFWRSLMNPLQKLAMFARSHEPGKPLSKSPVRERNDEVGVLIYSVHNMANRINDMIHDRYDMEIKQKESQLQLLYQQINPHLLYNTLESIYWKSSLEGNTGSAEMIKELSKLMRISLSRGKELITIEEELEHAAAYTSLQQMRYEYGFRIHWDISEEVRLNLIPKITLQPLIENAIIHGVMNMGEDGVILVTARTVEDNVIITVEDNGYKETDHSAINLMLSGKQSESSSGYGIRNVHRRIQLHFGDRYGLRYEAREDEGTRVIVIFPVRKNPEQNE
ncbi:cache domain-containing sensor histidine kinase [Cohnella silvisoli]|uniref:Histidine kinase n=1 Tax=Cohnella silvisoli TaxID=2873699 RepID=A0ABV1KU44_9BACL|nr:sensor histidine kinase [Cohnella silvisoli]MCD9023201.1 histidine kinase [Cohnella silvisoli]